MTPTYLFALLLYGPIAREIESSPPQQWHELHTILEACDRAVREAQKHMSIPRRFSLGLREMFALQPRLEHPRGRRALRVLEHPRFRAAYDLLLLRAELGLASTETAAWWTKIQEVSDEEPRAWPTTWVASVVTVRRALAAADVAVRVAAVVAAGVALRARVELR